MQTFTPYESYAHAAETINPTGQILIFYDSAISYIRQAKHAIRAEDFNTKYQMLEKASSIIHGLRACASIYSEENTILAMDKFYEEIDKLIISAQCSDDAKTCDAINHNLTIIRDKWVSMNNYSSVFMPENTPDEEHTNLLI